MCKLQEISLFSLLFISKSDCLKSVVKTNIGLIVLNKHKIMFAVVTSNSYAWFFRITAKHENGSYIVSGPIYWSSYPSLLQNLT
jgi:hypothetical protein